MERITLNDIEDTLGGKGARRRLAELVGVTPQPAGKWFLQGRIPPRQAEPVAQATGYSIEAVLKASGYTRRVNHNPAAEA